MGGLGLRSASRTSHAACFGSWADCLATIRHRHEHVAVTMAEALSHPPVSAVHLTGAARSRQFLAGAGFESLDWLSLLDGLRPEQPPECQFEPGPAIHGWQFFAAQTVETRFRNTIIWPRLSPSEAGVPAVAVRPHGWVAVLVCPFFASVRAWRPGVSRPPPPSPLAPFAPCLLQLPVWPSTRRPWPPPCSLLESGGFGKSRRFPGVGPLPGCAARRVVGSPPMFSFVTSICQWPEWMVAVSRWSWTASPCLGEHNSRWTPPWFLLSKLMDDPAANVQSETAQLLTRHDVSRPTRTQSSQALTGEFGWSSLLRRQVVAGLWKPSILSTSCPKRKRGRSRGSCATACVRLITTGGVRFWLVQRAEPSPSHCWSAAQWWVLTGTFLPRLRWSPIAATCLCRFDRAVFF